jgi:hypothetical protein
MHLATTTYAQFNFCHLADILAEEHHILLSDETLRRWLRPAGHGRPPRRRGKHRRRRTRRSRAGELLFLDGSPHPWFGPRHPDCCLLLASDDATGKPLWGKFQPEEDRDGCFEVCYHVFLRYGLPGAFYLDRASQFITTRKGGRQALHNPERDPTHFEEAMSLLKVGLIFAYSPQARGRGERLNGTFQDRLVAHYRVRGRLLGEPLARREAGLRHSCPARSHGVERLAAARPGSRREQTARGLQPDPDQATPALHQGKHGRGAAGTGRVDSVSGRRWWRDDRLRTPPVRLHGVPARQCRYRPAGGPQVWSRNPGSEAVTIPG